MAQTLRDLDDVKTFPDLDSALLTSKNDQKPSDLTNDKNHPNKISNDEALGDNCYFSNDQVMMQKHNGGRRAIGVPSIKSGSQKKVALYICYMSCKQKYAFTFFVARRKKIPTAFPD